MNTVSQALRIYAKQAATDSDRVTIEVAAEFIESLTEVNERLKSQVQFLLREIKDGNAESNPKVHARNRVQYTD